jgi:hypothetical protein
MSENGNNDNNQNKDINVEKRNVNRTENPGMVGSTFIKYAAYIIILLIVLYFVVTYVFPKI